MSGEQLAHPAARSMSLPFDALLSSANDAHFFDDDDAPISSASRRFSSDPAVPSSSKPKHHHHHHQERPSRKERVKALALWYDRLASRSSASEEDDDDQAQQHPLHQRATRHFQQQQQQQQQQQTHAFSDAHRKFHSRIDSWAHAHDDASHTSGRAERRDALRKLDTLGSLQQEVSRLRQILTQERSERLSLEQAASSLQNALQFSKKKVNDQKETITRLENDVRKAQSLAPCLKEILSVSERHYQAKEVALKRVIQGLSAERDSAVELSHRFEVMQHRSRPRASWTGQPTYN